MGRRIADMQGLRNTELGVSQWLTVDQSMIDRFADLTGDRQWIHVDVARAQREAPTGTTIAHGYLTLSLISALAYELELLPEDASISFNYGLDRLRFINPVKPGQRIRLRTRNLDFEEKTPGRFLVRNAATIEIEGEAKPALVAETLVMLVAANGG